ncbi:MBL fold metallo-hydrolase [Mucilaginibacter terrae]|uniref:Metallo-beta-lactamase family protein n=1 Tax=Mucilaginibacter terrae TaxID=1955052 RepID=A0ABU3GUP1_9SPHI|nr:MBL fold metallo-hydrolase [Mucilaginibacter terrae]MDT3403497.1 metallo-beta-lactamase family protein [Mucilaginibacter terrae]
MHITFHGAARNVTGSKHIVQLNDGTSILLDCGLFQGLGEKTEDMNEHFGFNPRKVDYMILSHAHIDHCGLIPKLVAEGYEGPIYCTAPTMELARILLMDSAKIQQQDAEYMNRQRKKRNETELTALYTEEQAMEALRLFKIVEYNDEVEVTPCFKFKLTDAGHVIGSAAIHLSILEDGKYTNITFSGDVGRYGDLLLRSPQKFPQADYIMLESTYGDSLHKDLGPIEDALRDIIHDTCIAKRGKVIIPAFSVGRTQELLYALNGLELRGQLPDVNYYVDSPLSLQATQVIKDHPEVYNKDVIEVMKVDHDPFMFKNLRFVQSTEESMALNTDTRPSVIISSSGMAEAGRVRHHIRNNINNKKNTILMVGYAEPSSLGGHLIRGDKEVYIFGDRYDVKAQVCVIKSMSAHGDYEDLLHFLNCQNPEDVKKLFLVHGEYDVQQKFADTLRDKGFKNIEIPYQHERVELE